MIRNFQFNETSINDQMFSLNSILQHWNEQRIMACGQLQSLKKAMLKHSNFLILSISLKNSLSFPFLQQIRREGSSDACNTCRLMYTCLVLYKLRIQN